MKLSVTYHNPPEKAVVKEIDLGSLEDIKRLEGDGITKHVKAEIVKRGYSFNRTSEGVLLELRLVGRHL